MPEQQQRYKCVREPADTWMVWDEVEEKPAEWPMPLVGLGEIDATVFCDVLNATNFTRTDAA